MSNHEMQIQPDSAELLVLVEGAIALYEGDALPLCRIARDAGDHEALRGFDAIGTALYRLRECIRNMEAVRHVSNQC